MIYHYISDNANPSHLLRSGFCWIRAAALPEILSKTSLSESLAIIGKLLGHRKVQTTAVYAHLARDSVPVAAERVSVSLGTDLEPTPDGSAVT